MIYTSKIVICLSFKTWELQFVQLNETIFEFCWSRRWLLAGVYLGGVGSVYALIAMFQVSGSIIVGQLIVTSKTTASTVLLFFSSLLHAHVIECLPSMRQLAHTVEEKQSWKGMHLKESIEHGDEDYSKHSAVVDKYISKTNYMS